MKKRIGSLALVLILIVGMSGGALATGEPDIDTLVNGSAAYVYGQVSVPQVASIGGEWAVLGLARAGYAVPQSWYDGYYTRVEQYVQECGGVLHPKKYTEYSRLLVALSSIGKDGRDVAGYDLTTALGDYRKTIWQGNNGPIWALMALDSANYPMPVNEAASVQATRQMYIDLILSVQMADGGWVLDNTVYTVSDPDMTGMALQALAKYTDQPAVASAVERGLDCISNMIKNRNLLTYTATTSESIDQVLVALCELGVDYRQNKYMKNGTNLLDALLQFRNANGSFKHDSAGTGDNQMSAEQGLYTLAAVKRFLNGQNSLYRMTDVLDLGGDGMPQCSSGNGSAADIVVNGDGSVSISVSIGDVTILLNSEGEYVSGENTYTVASTGNVPCVVLSRVGGVYTPVAIRNESGKHFVTANGNAWLFVAVKGDMNGDGELDIVDVVQNKAVSLGRGSFTALQKAIGDVSGDGIIDIIDVVRVKAAQLEKTALTW